VSTVFPEDIASWRNPEVFGDGSEYEHDHEIDRCWPVVVCMVGPDVAETLLSRMTWLFTTGRGVRGMLEEMLALHSPTLDSEAPGICDCCRYLLGTYRTGDPLADMAWSTGTRPLPPPPSHLPLPMIDWSWESEMISDVGNTMENVDENMKRVFRLRREAKVSF
jgi:hypothetical protein